MEIGVGARHARMCAQHLLRMYFATGLLLLGCRYGYGLVDTEQGPAAGGGGGDLTSGTGSSGTAGGTSDGGPASGGSASASGGGGAPSSGGAGPGSGSTTASGAGGGNGGVGSGGDAGGSGATAGSGGSGGTASGGGAQGGSAGSSGAGSGGTGGVGLGPGTVVTFGDRSGTDYPGTITETFIQMDSPDPIGSNTATWTVAGSRGGLSYSHGLMRIDVSVLPPATDVTGAVLHVVRSNQPGALGDLAWHVLLEQWAKYEAGWFERMSGVPWSGEGATGASRDEPDFYVFSPGTAGEDYSIPLSAGLVQGWVDNPSTNYGVACYGLDDADGFNFYSSTVPTQNLRPMLEVSYNP